MARSSFARVLIRRPGHDAQLGDLVHQAKRPLGEAGRVTVRLRMPTVELAAGDAAWLVAHAERSGAQRASARGRSHVEELGAEAPDRLDVRDHAERLLALELDAVLEEQYRAMAELFLNVRTVDHSARGAEQWSRAASTRRKSGRARGVLRHIRVFAGSVDAASIAFTPPQKRTPVHPDPGTVVYRCPCWGSPASSPPRALGLMAASLHRDWDALVNAPRLPSVIGLG